MTRFRQFPLILATGILVAGLISACGSSSHPPKNIVQRKTAAVKNNETQWVANVSGKAGAPSGQWRLELVRKTHLVYLRTPANKPYATGLTTSGNHMKFAVLRTCKGQSKPGTGLYTYQETSTQLTITKQSDSCAERAAVLTGQPWTKP